MALKLDADIADPDGFYEALIKAHENLSSDDSAALNARLVFLIAYLVGEQKDQSCVHRGAIVAA